MQIDLISLATVKINLGISSSEHDAAITAMIPVVSADVRRILNTDFTTVLPASVGTGTPTLSAVNDLSMGQVVYNPDIPDDTYIISYDWNTATYRMSANATDDITWINPTVTIAQHSAISKMIWYKISKSTTAAVNEKNVQSQSIGPVSKTYAQNEINSQWNYPQMIIDDLGVPFQEVG